MGINIKGMVKEKSRSVKFETLGDSGEGQISAAEMVDDPNGADKGQVLVITLTDEAGGERKLWARSTQMLEAIDGALEASGSDGIEIGDWLKVTYVSDKMLRSGRVMKVYKAEHIAGFSGFRQEAFE